MIIAGAMYTGGDGSRKRVTSVNGNTVKFQFAMSGAPGEMSADAFYEWLAQPDTTIPTEASDG